MVVHQWDVLEEWRNTPAGQAFATMDQVFALEGETVATDSESCVFPVALAGKRYFVKRYHRTKGLRSWVGYGRIRIEARNQLWFTEWGLPAAKVVAYGQDCCLSKTIRGAMITEAAENTQDLDQMAHSNNPLLKDRFWVQQVLVQVAVVTQIMHRHRFVHNDLKWRNILVTQDPLQPQIYLIDCPAGQRWFGPMLRYRIIKDLACLDKLASKHLSRTQRLAFFKLYRGCERLTPRDKKMIGKIVRFFAGRE